MPLVPLMVGPRSRCRNDMNGYLSGHAILSSGVRGRKGSYREGWREKTQEKRREGAGKGEKDNLGGMWRKGQRWTNRRR